MANGEVEERVEAMIQLIGLEEFGSSWPSELSGGMAQRVAIGRAFIQEPDLLLLDEPFGSLDALTREKMGAELLNIWQAQRTAVIMVTHSISEALLLSDRVLVFTPRPGRMQADMTVPLVRPRKEELRYTAEFQKLERSAAQPHPINTLILYGGFPTANYQSSGANWRSIQAGPACGQWH